MGFFKSLISDAVDSLKDQIVESVGEATNINLASLVAIQDTEKRQ